MENRLDKEIKQKLEERTIQPSSSAWERLSLQLDEQESSKKKGNLKWLWVVSVAASLALLFTILQKEETVDAMDEFVNPNQELVVTPVDTTKFVKDPIKAIKETVEEQERVVEAPKKIAPLKKTKVEKKQVGVKEVKSPEIIAIVDEVKKVEETKSPLKITEKTQNSNARIFVDSDALLYSVTHSKEDVRAFYKKYQVSRSKVLESIEKELKNRHISVDAKTILAEVEMDLNEESFQNNFYQLIKKRVSDVATAIANRNN